MSDFEYRDAYTAAAAAERERAADWDESERAWAAERQDALTRDASARRTPCPYCGRRENHRQSCQLFAAPDERIKDAGYELGDPKGASVP